jgi:hypothetical protein
MIGENEKRVGAHLILSEPPPEPSAFRVPDIVLIYLEPDEVSLLGNRPGLINKGEDLTVGETVDVIHVDKVCDLL